MSDEELFEQNKPDINAMGHRLVRAGWLKPFIWHENGCIFEFTEAGKIKLSQLSELLKQNQTRKLAELDLTGVTILDELGKEKLNPKELMALSFWLDVFEQSKQL